MQKKKKMNGVISTGEEGHVAGELAYLLNLLSLIPSVTPPRQIGTQLSPMQQVTVIKV